MYRLFRRSAMDFTTTSNLWFVLTSLLLSLPPRCSTTSCLKLFQAAQLEDLKQSLSGENQLIYTSLEQQIQIFKGEYGKLLANQAELESELISTKLKYALAGSERQRLLIRNPRAKPSPSATRQVESYFPESSTSEPPSPPVLPDNDFDS